MADPISAIGTVAGAVLSKRAADKQEKAIRKQADRDLAMREKMYQEDIARQEPFRQAGLTSVNRLLELYGPGGMYTKTPTMQDLLVDPGYSFRLSEGEKALARMQAARGQYLGGGAIRAGTRYGQELASQEFGNMYSRLMDQRAAETNALLNVARYGPEAAAQLGIGGRALASGAAAAYGNIGTAQANRAAQVGDIYQNVLGDVLKGIGQRSVPPPSRKSSYGGSSVPYNSPGSGYYERPYGPYGP